MSTTKPSDLLPTVAAATRLNLKRQQFQVLAQFFSLKPFSRRLLNGKSRTPGNLYDPALIGMLRRLSLRCRANGGSLVLSRLMERHR